PFHPRPHFQARQQVSAHAADPGSKGSPDAPAYEPIPVGSNGAWQNPKGRASQHQVIALRRRTAWMPSAGGRAAGSPPAEIEGDVERAPTANEPDENRRVDCRGRRRLWRHGIALEPEGRYRRVDRDEGDVHQSVLCCQAAEARVTTAGQWYRFGDNQSKSEY